MHLVADDVALRRHFHQAGLDEPVDVRLEAAEPGCERLGKHVDRALGKVHRRAALVRLAIERAALLHVVRHVGDVDAQPVVTVRQPLDRNRVVEIARVLAVDGDDDAISKISAPL